jgi:hypothetical protein
MNRETWIGLMLVGVIVLILWVAKVDPKSSKDFSADIGRIDANIALLDRSIDLHAGRLQALENLQSEVSSLDMDGKTYSSVSTSIGKLLVSVEEVSPTLNGFVVKLKIGNPNFMTMNDVEAIIYYGSPIKTLKKTILKDLLPGRWNSVEVIIAPATKSELARISISFNPSKIQLGTTARN